MPVGLGDAPRRKEETETVNWEEISNEKNKLARQKSNTRGSAEGRSAKEPRDRINRAEGKKWNSKG